MDERKIAARERRLADFGAQALATVKQNGIPAATRIEALRAIAEQLGLMSLVRVERTPSSEHWRLLDAETGDVLIAEESAAVCLGVKEILDRGLASEFPCELVEVATSIWRERGWPMPGSAVRS